MKSILFLMLLLFPAADLTAQTRITVDATGEVHLPADLVEMRINLTATASSAAEAFEEHKRQEEYLAGLIRRMNLDESLLSHQPIGISGRPTRDGTARQFTTTQTVHLSLKDFPRYEELQLRLIENGFENFSGQFSSTGIEEGKRKALKLALDSAREKADLIAVKIGKKVKGVESVNHSTRRVAGPSLFGMAEMLRDGAPSMIDFETTVPVSSSVTVVYLVE